MLIQRIDEDLRRTVFIASGKVLAKDGQSPITRTVTNNTHRLGFGVLTGTTINAKQERTYQTIPCGVYKNNTGGKILYDIALTLKKNDVVFLCGYVHKGVYTDHVTGEQKESTEYRVEYILPLRMFSKYIKDVNEEEIPTLTKTIAEEDDGCSF